MDKEIIKNMRTAIKKGDLESIKKLLEEHDGLLNVTTVFGTWLHIAASQGRCDIAEYFIDCGMDINKEGDISGGNALRSAAERGHLDIVELLYKKGSRLDVSKATKNPLFGAIQGGYYDVVKFLVDSGIDIKASYSIGQMEYIDAYEYARQYGRTEIANYLRKQLEKS